MKRLFLTFALAALVAGGTIAGRGDQPGPDLTRADFSAVDFAGQLHAAAEAGAAATVWVFISYDCPICNSYAPELNRLQSEFSGRGVRINLVYTDPDLSAEALRVHAKEHGYTGALFDDGAHRLTKACGVTVTPEVAVVTADHGIAYRGRIDNRYPQPGRERALTTTFDLRAALEAILNHRPVPISRTVAVGCALESP